MPVLDKTRSSLLVLNLVAMVAVLAVVIGPPAVAAGKRLITGADVQDASLTGADVADGSLYPADLAGATGKSPKVVRVYDTNVRTGPGGVSAAITCPAGNYLVNGYAGLVDDFSDARVDLSYPWDVNGDGYLDTWRATAMTQRSGVTELGVGAYCAPIVE